MDQGLAVESLNRINGQFILDWINGVNSALKSDSSDPENGTFLKTKLYQGNVLCWVENSDKNTLFQAEQVVKFLEFILEDLAGDNTSTELKNRLTRLRAILTTYLDTYQVTKDAKKAEFIMESLGNHLQVTDLSQEISDLTPELMKYLALYKELTLPEDHSNFLDDRVQAKIDLENRKKQLVELRTLSEIHNIQKKNQSKSFHLDHPKQASDLKYNLHYTSETLKQVTDTYPEDKRVKNLRFLKQLLEEKEQLQMEILEIEEAKKLEKVDENYSKEMRKLKSILRMKK